MGELPMSDEDMEKFPISDEDWTALFKLIEAQFTTGLHPVPAPVFFLHAGQPGNLLIETTLKDTAQALATLARMKAAGYTTWLQVLAVPYRWSWLGIYARYEAIKMRTGVARIVKESDHDDRFKRLQENLRAVVASSDLDYFTIFRRQLRVEASATTALAPAAEGKEDVLDIFFSIVNHPMDEEEKDLFKEGCARVAQMMRDREAWSGSIEAFEEKSRRLLEDGGDDN
jgi:hypothetical protein